MTTPPRAQSEICFKHRSFLFCLPRWISLRAKKEVGFPAPGHRWPTADSCSAQTRSVFQQPHDPDRPSKRKGRYRGPGKESATVYRINIAGGNEWDPHPSVAEARLVRRHQRGEVGSRRPGAASNKRALTYTPSPGARRDQDHGSRVQEKCFAESERKRAGGSKEAKRASPDRDVRNI